MVSNSVRDMCTGYFPQFGYAIYGSADASVLDLRKKGTKRTKDDIEWAHTLRIALKDMGDGKTVANFTFKVEAFAAKGAWSQNSVLQANNMISQVEALCSNSGMARTPISPSVSRESHTEKIIERQIVKVRCRYCGALNDDGLSACKSCGARL